MIATSGVWSLNPQWLALVVGSVIPLVVGLVSKYEASDRLKAIINGLLSAIAGAGTTALTTNGKVQWQSWVIGIISTWIASIATYYGFWKPSGVAPAVSKATGRIGIGRRSRKVTRTAGLKGRLPVLPPHERLPIQYADTYLAAPLPTVAYPVDVTEGITDFGMMGNDSYGNCGAAGEVHGEMTTARAAGTQGPDPMSTLAVDRYCEYVGSRTPPGPGVVLAKYLLWMYQKGWIKAFAPVDHNNKALCDAFMQNGYFLYCGVGLTDSDEADFQNETKWGSNGNPVSDPNNGHCIIKVRADGKGTDAWVTWGAVQESTEQWTQACLEEAWLVVTTEEQLARFTPALLQDIQALGGTGGVSTPVQPQPEPAPQPTPPQPAPSGPQEVIAAIDAALEKALSTFRADIADVLSKL